MKIAIYEKDENNEWQPSEGFGPTADFDEFMKNNATPDESYEILRAFASGTPSWDFPIHCGYLRIMPARCA